MQACPHDNVAIGFRVPGEELADDRRRSSIGRLSRRPDLAALALLFTFGALLNAFAMVGPVYATEQWIAMCWRTSSEAPVLALVFVAALVLLPLALCGGGGLATVGSRGGDEREGIASAMRMRWCRSAPAYGSRTTVSIFSPAVGRSCR